MKAAENQAKEKVHDKPAASIACREDRLTGVNIYRIQGAEKTVLFDAGSGNV